MDYDVLVLGGGIVGASTAYALRRQGLTVALIEQFAPGHTRGSSHGDSRIVRFNYSEAIYVEMALLGYPAWERLEQAAGQALWQKTGLIEYGPANCLPVAESEANLRLYDLPYEWFSADEAERRFPQFRFAAGSEILYQPQGAVAFATPAVLALWRLFQDSGGTAISGQRVEQIEILPDAVVLRAGEQSWRGRHLVLAAGGWSRQWAAALDLDLPITVTQETLAYFPAKDTAVNHRVGVMPCMVDYHQVQAQPFYCLPQVEIAGVKTGWHHSGTVIDADHRVTRSPEILRQMQGWVERAFPHLQPEPIELIDCLYSNTPDYHFILDRHPRYAHVVIGAGFSGHGFKFGPILGELLADLVTGADLPLSLETFAIRRFETPETLHRHIGA